MAPGFLLESGDYDTPRVTQWVAGAPEKSFWVGLRLTDRDVLGWPRTGASGAGTSSRMPARTGVPTGVRTRAPTSVASRPADRGRTRSCAGGPRRTIGRITPAASEGGS
jgi:hypothetical protein